MKLSKLLKKTNPVKISRLNADQGTALIDQVFFSNQDPDIRSIHYRSHDVKPGGLFVAIAGHTVDGHDYIDDAIQNGAAVIVTQKPLQKNAIIVEVENTRKSLAEISSQFYENPSEKLVVIGITGTNGKTTTAYLIESILISSGHCCGVIGTINYRYNDQTFENPVTTPESPDLQRIMAEMLANGVSHVILEVSSHAIDLYRIHQCQFNVGVFTNLTQDHLDYHGDMDTYWACKKKFFSEYLISGPKKNQATAVINCDNSKGKELAKLLTAKIATTGRNPNNVIHPYQVKSDHSGIAGMISTPAGDFPFKSLLAGKHNLENILAATGVSIMLDLRSEDVRSGLEKLTGVPGRLERISNHINRYIYVDYAHTPDALKNVLSSLRAISTGRIICIFGCGGDRDVGKRARMGAIAVKISDLAVITSDNPRSENPIFIIDQILEGITPKSINRFTSEDLKAGFRESGFVVEPDRKKAIRLGINASEAGDTILIAGKGHETYQILGEQIIPFDDRVIAQKALAELETDCLDSARIQNC